jgi:hypothetical protein
MKLFDPTKPLGLPEGSVRALLALTAWGVFLGKAWVGAVPEELTALVSVLTVTYFQSRKNGNGNGGA